MKKQVHKHGGSFSRKAETIFAFKNYWLKATKEMQLLIVFSAREGITRLLSHIVITATAKTDRTRYAVSFKKETIKTLLKYDFYAPHMRMIKNLFLGDDRKNAISDFRRIYSELISCIDNFREGYDESAFYASVLKFGELVVCSIYFNFLNSIGIVTKLIDSRDYITTKDPYEGTTLLRIDNSFMSSFSEAQVIIAPGFIGRNRFGKDTVFPYDGSDLSALYFAKGIKQVEKEASLLFWKDVQGFYFEDPFYNPKAEFSMNMSLSQYQNLPSFPIKLDAVVDAIESDIPVNMGYFLDPYAEKATIYKA